MKTLAERLAHALKVRKKTPADLSRATGKSESAVSQWISGDSKSMRSDSLMATCVFLSCNPQWMASGKGISGLEKEPVQFATSDSGVNSWPFKSIEFERWERLSERMKGRVEQAVIDAVSRIEDEQKKLETAGGFAAKEGSDGNQTQEPRKQRRA